MSINFIDVNISIESTCQDLKCSMEMIASHTPKMTGIVENLFFTAKDRAYFQNSLAFFGVESRVTNLMEALGRVAYINYSDFHLIFFKT